MAVHLDQLPGLVGSELGVSEWITLDQERINRFAEVTEDRQWIHVDETRAEGGPFGTTIAHGYLTLSMIPMLVLPLADFDGTSMQLNYGLDRVRFPRPVPVNSRIRARVSVHSVEERARGLCVSLACSIELEGVDSPACVANQLVLLVRT